jgi:hypothetical protein
MGIDRGGLNPGWRRIWQRAIGVVVIYALVLQSVFLGLAGVAASVSADEGLPAFELCLNGNQDGPLSPAGLPGHHDNTHCILCFAETYCPPGLPPSSVERVNLEIENALWPVSSWHLSAFFEYSSAQPRGPPFGA